MEPKSSRHVEKAMRKWEVAGEESYSVGVWDTKESGRAKPLQQRMRSQNLKTLWKILGCKRKDKK